MKQGNVVCIAGLLAMAVAGAAQGQQHQDGSQPRNVTNDRISQRMGQDELAGRAWERAYDERSTQAMANVPKVRAHLASAWQKFGMSPQDAETVAAAYRVSDNNLVRPKSLYGKTDEEIAGMLQSALASKQFQLADMLLIEYERKRLHPTSVRPDASSH